MLAAGAVFLLNLIATGCSSSSTAIGTASPTPIPSGSPTPTPSPTPTANYFVGLDYPSVPPTTDPTYGEIQGYAPLAAYPLASSSPSPSPIPTISSQLVTVHCNHNIQFFNLDRLGDHTASSLGPANGMNWPTSFNNPNGTVASPLLTPISYAGFSSGNLTTYLASGWYSLVYSTGNSAGSYYFGDYFDYNPLPGNPSMRTVINVLCP
jgi:hypothetical protein